MDKYVVRQKKDNIIKVSCGSNSTNLKQTRIENLAGVVILEDIVSWKQQLADPKTSTEDVLQILTKLQGKKPSREILKSTGIGKTVHKLCKHDNEAVSLCASNLYDYWKSHILNILQRQPIEVKSDIKTENMRSSAVKLVNKGLNDRSTSEKIERAVFKMCNSILSPTYSRIIRKIHFTLKNDEDQRNRVLQEDCDLNEFVKEFYKYVVKVYSKT